MQDKDSKEIQPETKDNFAISGYCRDCQTFHSLGPGNSHKEAKKLLRRLCDIGSIDIFSPVPDKKKLALGHLYGDARGKMFGVLEYRKQDGEIGFLYAFSGQYFGIWEVSGWVPPIFDLAAFLALNTNREREISRLTDTIRRLGKDNQDLQNLRRRRRQKSRILMEDIIGLYRLQNFSGVGRSLSEAFSGAGGIPTGTGDCCAPKLLHHAAIHGLYPLGLCEFFIGRSPRSANYSQGDFASACKDRCAPILGFQLCGLHTNKPL